MTETSQPTAQAEGVKFLRLENSAAIYAIGSGTYHFQSTPQKPPVSGFLLSTFCSLLWLHGSLKVA